ncbi:MAG: Rieske 2Fe-2S domain-containing protein [Rhodospirillales bacterium]|nr:Rieske 2Fe-2S domain-containing protein [Rhodospirillales bacterium]
MSDQKICSVTEIEDNNAINVIAVVDGKQRNVMAAKWDGTVYVYLNSCPHTGAPLDFIPGKFLSMDKKHLQCSTHGALFRFDDGYCIFGPCTEESLTPLSFEIRDENVYLID